MNYDKLSQDFFSHMFYGSYDMIFSHMFYGSYDMKKKRFFFLFIFSDVHFSGKYCKRNCQSGIESRLTLDFDQFDLNKTFRSKLFT